jgi:hypothetical protein
MTGKITSRERYLRSVPESEVQSEVQKTLTMFGWWWYHAPDNKPSAKTGRVQRITPGFPDIFAVRGTRILAVEIKRETGHTTDEQDEVLARLQLTGKVEVWVVRPSNLDEFRHAVVPEFLR